MMVALRLLRVLVIFVLTNAVNCVEEDDYYEYGELVEDYPNHLYRDNEVGQLSLHYYEPHVGNTTLKKCFCGADQVWNGSTCQDIETVVLVMDYHTGNAAVVNTTRFGNVTIGESVCPEGTLLFELGKDHSKHVSFAILDTGSLQWEGHLYDNYCVENNFGPDGLPNSWFAQVCLEPPVVPECCPVGYSFDVSGTCIESLVNRTFSPTLFVEGHQRVWPVLTHREIVNITCGDHEETYIVELDSKTAFLRYEPEKTVLDWQSSVTLSDRDSINKYCVGIRENEDRETEYVAKLCYLDRLKDHEEKCMNRTCVRKCCGSFEMLLHECQAVGSEALPIFQPVFHHPSNLTPGAPEPDDLTIVHGFPLCKDYFRLEPHLGVEDDKFYLLTNGYLHVPAFPNNFPPSKYCFDTFFEDDHQFHTLPLICFTDEDKVNPICASVQTYLYPILLLISVGFLAITLMVYISVPELHAKVHGKCLVSHVTALLVAYVSLFIVQRATGSLSHFACKFMASVTHISFLAAFFWLNVMCFDIWWTLKSMRPVPETGELSRLRFKLYSLYSWGCPLLIAITSVIMQSLPEDYDVIRPDFGTTKCWFKDNKSLWAYFYGFVLVLVVANIIFFAQVAYILIVAQNDPILQRTRQQNRERMWLYVKLFLVMGITWLAEVISWQEGTCEAWIFTDIINSLQGVSIFLIFICKRNLLKKIRSKWEPYLRHVKNVVGSKRLSHSKFSTSGTGNTAREQLSFSSSENRPNHSAASQKTVGSQLSLEPSSINRKISTGSMTSTTGVQVHTQYSIPMDTIAENTHPEPDKTEFYKNKVNLPLGDDTSVTKQEKEEHVEVDEQDKYRNTKEEGITRSEDSREHIIENREVETSVGEENEYVNSGLELKEDYPSEEPEVKAIEETSNPASEKDNVYDGVKLNYSLAKANKGVTSEDDDDDDESIHL